VKKACSVLLILALLVSAAACTRTPAQPGEPAGGPTASPSPSPSPTPSAAVPSPESSPSPDPGPAGPSVADPLAFSDEAALRAFLTGGRWTYYVPDGLGPQITLELSEDGGCSAWLGAGRDAIRFDGRWRLDRLFAGEEDLPDWLCLDVSSTNAPEPPYSGMTSLGDFLIENWTICGGWFMMRMGQVNNGDSLFSLAADTFSPVLYRTDPADRPSYTDAPRTDDSFFAVCWRVVESPQDTVLWLDDADPDDPSRTAGRHESIPYTLAPDADVRCTPSLFARGGFVAWVQTDAAGNLILLDWASPDDAPEPAMFDRDDEILGGLTLRMTQDEVRARWGSPESVSVSPDNPYGPETVWEYQGVTLSFFDMFGTGEDLLGDILITNPAVSLATGLRVGFTAREVLAAYCSDRQDRPISDWGRYLYGDYLFTYENGYALPERYEQTGYVIFPSEGDDYYVISYDSYLPLGEYGEGEYPDFVCEQSELVFYIDCVTDTILAIRAGVYTF